MSMKNLSLKLLWVMLIPAALALSPGLSSAATYYVDPAGTNSTGDGSQGKPWASLSYACSKAKLFGDTIVINPGAYTDSAQCILYPGVNISGAGKDRTVIKSNYSDWYIRADSNPPVEGNQTISGFKIDGNNKTLAHGIWVTGRHHFTINNVDLVSIKTRAIQLQGYDYWPNNDAQYFNPPNPPPGHASGITISNVTITGCSGSGTGGQSLFIQSIEDSIFDNIVIDESAGTGGLGNPFQSWPGWMRRCTIRNSTFSVNPSLSMDAITSEMFNLEEGNEIYNNTYNEGYISFVGGVIGTGSFVLKFHDNRLINKAPLGYAHEIAVDNLDFYNNYITTQSLGIWSSPYVLTNIRIRNNIIYNTKGQGITIMNVPPSAPGTVKQGINGLKIYNNVIDTSYQGSTGIAVTMDGVTLTNLEIKNNVIMNETTGVYLGPGVINPVVSWNNFWNVTNKTTGNGNMSVNPQFIASGNRYDTYYTLSPGSPLIDAGTNVGLPFQGSAPDIGAFEFGNTIGPPSNLRVVP